MDVVDFARQKTSRLDRVGLQKTTLLDFPGEVAATVFIPGCNLRCPYCHNPGLVSPPFPEDMIPVGELDAFLSRRARVLGGVCITGGEPLVHPDIGSLVGIIRSHGLQVKLDTNGTFPGRLEELLASGLVDYVAMDIKTAPDLYDTLLTGRRRNGSLLSGRPPADDEGDLSNADGGPARQAGGLGEKVRLSVEVLRNSGVPYELRTTVVPGIAGPGEMPAILTLLPGAERYVLTPFRGGTTLDPTFAALDPPSCETMQNMLSIAENGGIRCARLSE
jgi:pyruvate formate lyase activating enzyme